MSEPAILAMLRVLSYSSSLVHKGGLDMTDKEIQQAVLRELDYEPQIRSTEIGVAVKDGIITLSGNVDSYSNRYHAELAAKRVAGVKAIANDLEVHLPSSSERTDEDIARAAVRVLEDRISVPRDQVKITVRDGRITLEGDVAWQYQKEATAAAVRHLLGVKGVSNLITIKPHVSSTAIRTKIEAALQRAAALDAQRITVETE